MNKRVAYPVLIKKEEDMYLVRFPDFDRVTEGYDFADAIYMARDLIGIYIVMLQDDKKPIPEPNHVPYSLAKDEVLTYVDIDPEVYRMLSDNRMDKRKCILPNWMTYKADQMGWDLSLVLQEALREKFKGIE